MTAVRRLFLILMIASLAACAGDSAPESLASTESEEEATTTSPDEGIAVSSEAPPTSAPSKVDSSSTSAAPTTTTTTTTTTSTTTVPVTPSCSTARYDIEVPTGWAEDDCTRFTSGSFPAADAPIEFRPEIDLAFTTSENFAQSIGRIHSTEIVFSSTSETVDGLPAQRFVLRDEWFDVGERTVVVVDAGDGVLFASANELIDIQGPIQTDLAVHYAQTLTIFNAMLADISIVEATGVPCPAPVLTNPTVLKTGVADIDGDGDAETLQLIASDDLTVATVDGLANGTVWGSIQGWVNPGFSGLGWHDWDQDGVPEIIHRGDGPASGDLFEIRTVNGCALVSVVNQDGEPMGLLRRASGLSANDYLCMYDQNGALSWLETTATSIDADDGTSSIAVTPFSYSNGVLTSAGTTTITSPPAGPPTGVEGCVVELF